MVGAAAGVVGSIYSANRQSSAAQDAADTSAESSRYATDMQREVYDQTREDNAPWRNAGSSALNRLSYLLGTGSGSSQSTPQVESRADIYNRLRGQFTTGGGTSQNSGNSGYGSYNGQSFAGENNNWFNEDWTPGQQNQLSQAANGSTGSFDENGLNSAVDSELARQQQAYDDYNSQQQSNSSDPEYGSLMRNFSMADYEADPGYAFRQSEGEKGINRSLASRGRYVSGAALRELNRYNSDLASQEYGNAYNRYNTNNNNRFNRLASVAGLGQTANGQSQSAGQNYANQSGNYAMTNAANQGNAQLSGANAQASGWAGAGNALGSYRSSWGNSGNSGSTGYGGSAGYSWGGTNGAQDFSNGWNSSNYG